ncbi:hypothetical protein DUNSADRAFT_12484 [Dunaliella salina]|uniref:Encoded protein n=1 Tax=Dunaliella salina TaxID=3046 RepID=A0ABQ7H3X0_DUNSA|nr:hypothetical protein DUNSADRAFT_12484 [Dunaliella salina]|eukprot:KAF5841556.1 hypothetical protein DUNSADRAFT_12484 [Dunaliella salina]
MGGVPIKGKGVMETWIWKHPPQWKECTSGLPPLPPSCALLHKRFCTPHYSHCSAELPGSLLLPKVIQASLQRSNTTPVHENSHVLSSQLRGLFVMGDADDQRRKSGKTCDSSLHTLSSPKCSLPPSSMAPASIPDNGCLPSPSLGPAAPPAAFTRHQRASFAPDTFLLLSPRGSRDTPSPQQERGSLNASLLEAELKSWASSHRGSAASLKESKAEQGQERDKD